MRQKILILDFGSQVAQLIARRVREQQVYCELHPFDVSDDFIRNFGAQGIILSGGPNSVYEALEWQAPQAVFELGVPVLGGFFWGAGHAVVDMFKHGSGLGEVLKGGLVWSFMSAIMSVYLAPPFAVMNITGFFLRRRALQRVAGVPGGQGTAA